jgi:hypothetical protein
VAFVFGHQEGFAVSAVSQGWAENWNAILCGYGGNAWYAFPAEVLAKQMQKFRA